MKNHLAYTLKPQITMSNIFFIINRKGMNPPSPDILKEMANPTHQPYVIQDVKFPHDILLISRCNNHLIKEVYTLQNIDQYRFIRDNISGSICTICGIGSITQDAFESLELSEIIPCHVRAHIQSI